MIERKHSHLMLKTQCGSPLAAGCALMRPGHSQGAGVVLLNQTITTVETHTAGEPFRIVTSGFPRPQGTRIVDGPFPRRTVIEVINGVGRNSGSSDNPISHFELRKGGQIRTAS